MFTYTNEGQSEIIKGRRHSSRDLTTIPLHIFLPPNLGCASFVGTTALGLAPIWLSNRLRLIQAPAPRKNYSVSTYPVHTQI